MKITYSDIVNLSTTSQTVIVAPAVCKAIILGKNKLQGSWKKSPRKKPLRL